MVKPNPQDAVLGSISPPGLVLGGLEGFLQRLAIDPALAAKEKRGIDALVGLYEYFCCHSVRRMLDGYCCPAYQLVLNDPSDRQIQVFQLCGDSLWIRKNNRNFISLRTENTGFRIGKEGELIDYHLSSEKQEAIEILRSALQWKDRIDLSPEDREYFLLYNGDIVYRSRSLMDCDRWLMRYVEGYFSRALMSPYSWYQLAFPKPRFQGEMQKSWFVFGYFVSPIQFRILMLASINYCWDGIWFERKENSGSFDCTHTNKTIDILRWQKHHCNAAFTSAVLLGFEVGF